MFPLLVLITLLGQLSLVACLLIAACYGIGLILLVGMIRNVRQEISRNSLRRVLYGLAVDHFLSAGLALNLSLLLIYVPGMRGCLPLVDNPGAQDVELLVFSVGLFMLFFSLLWATVGTLMLLVQSHLKFRSSVQRELAWESWFSALVVAGCVLQVPTGFFFLLIAGPLLWQSHRLALMNRQGNLIWTLCLAVSRGLPLGAEVQELSQGLWGRQRQQLEKLAESLNAGQSIANALERQPGLIPHSVVMQIRLGEETGTLRQILVACGAGQVRRHAKEGDVVSTQHAFMILLIPVSLMPLIIGFLGYFIAPKFKKIFDDFGVGPTELSKSLAYFSGENSSGLSLIVFACFVLVGGAIAILFRDWEREWPFLSWLAPRHNAPPILKSLALLVRENRPLTAGLQALESSHVRRSVRMRLTQVIEQADQGGDMWGALVNQRLIGWQDLLLLRAAERVRNLPWALEQIAETIEQRHWQRVRIILEFAFPLAIIMIGLVVLAIVVPFFLPLVVVLENLSKIN